MDRSTRYLIFFGIITVLAGASVLSWVYFNTLKIKRLVGIMYTPAQEYHVRVAAQLKEVAAVQGGVIDFREFTAATNADPMLVCAAAQEALDDQSLELIVCVGAICSQCLVHLSKRRESKVPILFIGADNPVKLGLIDSLELPGGFVTGVIALDLNTLNPADLLYAVKPAVKKVLLPYSVYDPTGVIEAQVQSIRSRLHQLNVSIDMLPITCLSNASFTIASRFDGHDVLMYVEGDQLSSLSSGLVRLCEKRSITLFAGSIDAANNAALCYAVDTRHEASAAFQLIKKIVIDRVPPSIIPVEQPKHCRDFIINTKLCAEQGLADIDVQKVVAAIRADERFVLVRDNIVVK